MEKWNVEEMTDMIQQLRQIAEDLKEKGKGIQTLERTVDRILVGIKLLEINISDVRSVL
jgi:hypothetical protein